jgi:lipoprotein-releasing system ATP-binding protein
MTEVVLGAAALAKTYIAGDGSPVPVLVDVALEVAAGESVAVVGESGTGKSTLLHLLGGLDRPSSGDVLWQGHRVTEWDDETLAQRRARTVGFVFQSHHLLREFTALENVTIPQLLLGVPPVRAQERARDLLARLGLEARLHHKPAQLSGGEQQRVAVARALANHPPILLADEPTGNLDPRSSDRLADLLFEVHRYYNTALVIVTHNVQLARRADRVLQLDNGRLVPTSIGSSAALPSPV